MGKDREKTEGVTERLDVALGERSYPIHIGRGILRGLGAALSAQMGGAGRIALVTNPTVRAFHGAAALESLKQAGFDVLEINIPDGEEFKSLLWADFIYGELLAGRLERGSFLVALGGGVIGDITGFAASTYMRGIRFAQVPTTLLAQVDSSVGGKTGVNHPLGKNMIGSFWQPSLVWIDTDTLGTLPKRQFLAGMAEVIKYGVIRDEKLFSFLEKNKKAVLGLEPEALQHIIRRSCEIKARVVSLDEREAGLRAILNFGHTVGHAIESLTGYTKYLHGEAVAIGMCLEARTANAKGLLKKKELKRIVELVASCGLPTGLPKGLIGKKEIASAMRLDKKVLRGAIRVVLPEAIGKVRVEPVGEEEFFVF